jgi:hypothetical protein
VDLVKNIKVQLYAMWHLNKYVSTDEFMAAIGLARGSALSRSKLVS